MSKCSFLFISILILSIHSDEITKDLSSNIPTLISIPNSAVPQSGSNSTEIPLKKSSKGGLSTGAICAIAIPCVAALLGVGLAKEQLPWEPWHPLYLNYHRLII